MSQIAIGEGKYCSNDCRFVGRWGPEPHRVEIACAICSKPVTVTKSKAANGAKYCSTECRGIGRRNRVTRTCEQCGITFERAASTVKNGGGRFCKRACNTLWKANDPETVQRVRDMSRAQVQSRAPTRPEKALYALMDEFLGDRWERQHPVGHWTVDAAAPELRLVVQADGDYWHGHAPKSLDDPRIRANVANDKRQAVWMRKQGWTLLRLTETELKRDLDGCRTRLTAAIATARERELVDA